MEKTIEFEVSDGLEKMKLKQNIGFIRGSSLVVGTVIGSGIFIFPQNILMLTGSVGLSLVVWTLGGLLAFLGVLTSAEVSSVVGKSGSTYAYLYECYGRMPAFLFVWTVVTIAQPSMLAVASLTFAEYLLALVPFCGGPPLIAVKLCAVAAIVTLTLINSNSTSWAAPVQVICTVLKLSALSVIIVGGIVRMAQGHTKELATGFQGTSSQLSDIALAFYSINFSYGGWDSIYTIFEEVKNPQRNLLACAAGGILVVSAVYILVNVSFLTALTQEQLLASSAVAVTWGDIVLHKSTKLLIPIAILVSVFGSASCALFARARTVFAAARDNSMPQFLSFIHVTRYSPLPAILICSSLAILFVIPADIRNIINFLAVPMGAFHILSDSALFRFRRSKPHAPRFIKVPLIIPLIQILYNIFLIVVPLVLDPRIEFLYATCFVLAGVVLYVPFVHYRLKPRLIDQVEIGLQMVLRVSPTTYDKEN